MSRSILLVIVALSVGACVVVAQGNSQGKGKGKDKDKGQGQASVQAGVQAGVSVVFSSSERRMILDHYNPGGKGLPPGLAKRSDLPPGLEKQLRKNGRLPPGLDKKIDPFPMDLERRFPPLCSGCRRGVLGTTAVILSAAGTILDAIDMATR
jgi:hypothetical protein